MKINRLLFALLMAATLVFAQGRGKGAGPMTPYDPSAETSISGTVEEVTTMDVMCHAGTHVVVKTEKGSTEAALGPTQFLTDKKLELKKGDQVQIIGAKANTQHGEMFVARQITSSGKTITLRDEKGTPLWPRGMCR